MAIYNPKRARELEAAARLAESQRQRELAKGQREQRTTEQILGLVEGLIGAAPKALEAYQAGEAQKILSGERGLERAKPDNILEEIGQFITSPLEPGAKRMARAAAPQMAPAEVAKLQPLTSKAVKERIAAGPRPLDAPSERKELSKEQFEERVVQAMPVEATARYVLDESPVLQLLPERERQALAAGETQRVQAEQTAAEREAEAADLEKKLIESKIFKNKQAGKAKQTAKKLSIYVDAAMPRAEAYARELTDQISSDDPNVSNSAIDKLAIDVEAELQEAVDRGELEYGSTEYKAVKSKILEKAVKFGTKKKPEEKVIQPYIQEMFMLNNIVRLTDLRRESGWNPSQEKIIKELALEGIDFFGLETLPQSMENIETRLNMTPLQRKFFTESLALRREIMVALNGPGVLSNQDTRELAKAALNPFTTNEEWIAQANGMLERVSMQFNDRLSVHNSLYAMPGAITKFAANIPSNVGQIQENKQFGGEAEAQRALESMVESFGPIVAAGTALAARGGESAASTALEGLKKILPQQQPAAAPTAIPPPQKPTDMDPEVFYLQERQGGNLNPSTESVLIVDTDKGRFLYVVKNDELEAKQESIKKITPNAGFSVYSGNDAGGK